MQNIHLAHLAMEYPELATMLSQAIEKWSELSRQKLYDYFKKHGADPCFVRILIVTPPSEAGSVIEILEKGCNGIKVETGVAELDRVLSTIDPLEMVRFYAFLAKLRTSADITALIVTRPDGKVVDVYDEKGLKSMLIMGVNEYVSLTDANNMAPLPGGSADTELATRIIRYVKGGSLSIDFTGIEITDCITQKKTQRFFGKCVEAVVLLSVMKVFKLDETEDDYEDDEYDDEKDYYENDDHGYEGGDYEGDDFDYGYGVNGSGCYNDAVSKILNGQFSFVPVTVGLKDGKVVGCSAPNGALVCQICPETNRCNLPNKMLGKNGPGNK